MPPKQSIVSQMPEHPTHVPRPSYRDSSHSEHLRVGSWGSTSTTGAPLTTCTAVTNSTVITSPLDVENGPRSPALPALNLSQPTSSTPRPSSARSSAIPGMAPPPKNKKKSSFLGTLFTKEPSTDAFLQMQNQSRKQLAQNPTRKNPPGMSGVSSIKIPQHVPKVNSKWDGMPKRSEESHRRTHSRTDSQRTSTRSSSTRSRSADPSSHRGHSSHLSDSTATSSPANTRRSRKNDSEGDKRVGFHEAESVVKSAPSSSSSITRHHRSHSITARSQSLRSPSGTSLPQITSFFPNDIPEPPGLPQMYGAPALSQDPTRAAKHEDGTRDVPRLEEPSAEAASDTGLSGSSSPLEHSPVTPFSDPVSVQHLGQTVVNLDDSLSFSVPELKLSAVVLRSSGPDVLGPPTVTRKVSKDSLRAFLAGEARPLRLSGDDERSLRPKSILKKENKVFGPTVLVQQDLEKRPDSSRARLGLRASMIRSSDTVPWHWEEAKHSLPDTSNRASTSKMLLPKGFGIFGKS